MPNGNPESSRPKIAFTVFLALGIVALLINAAVSRIAQEQQWRESSATPLPTPSPTPQQVAAEKKAQEQRNREAKEFQKLLDKQVAEAAKQAEDEINFNGLVFLKKKERWEESKYGSRYITGVIENRTGEKLSFVSIRYKIFDKQGDTVVETPIDNIGGLDIGERWKFKVLVLYEESLRYAVDTIEGVKSL